MPDQQGRPFALMNNLQMSEPCLPRWVEMVLDPNAIVHGACLLPPEHASRGQYRGEKGEEVLPDGVIMRVIFAGRAHTRWESEQMQRSCDFNGGDTIADMQFAINLLHMRFDRIDGDHQVAGNFAIRATSSQQT